MDNETIMSLTIDQLKEKLTELGLSTTGKKQVLQDRLKSHHEIIEDDFEDATDEMDVHSHFTLKDVQDSLSTFDGNRPNIYQWLEEFEDSATAVKWNSLQKFIYAKQLLKGAASMFIRSQSNITSWTKLKNCLCEEFGNSLSKAEIHKLLASQKKKHRVSCLEFLYNIMEIAKPIKLDEESLIEYFIEGIPDYKQNKVILYEAKTILELKQKIKIYEKVNSKSHENMTNKQNFNSNQTRQQNIFSTMKCIHCPNLKNHLTENCRKAANICFKCNQKGHWATHCNNKRSAQDNNNKYDGPDVSSRNFSQYSNESQTTTQKRNDRQQNHYNKNREQIASDTGNNVQRKNQNQTIQTLYTQLSVKLYKTVKIQNVTFNALVDTGSDACLLSKSILDSLQDVNLIKDTLLIYGIGHGEINTLGIIPQRIEIDNISLIWPFHVVNDIDIFCEAIIGNDILKVLNMTITNGEIVYKAPTEFKQDPLGHDPQIKIVNCEVIDEDNSQKETNNIQSVETNTTTLHNKQNKDVDNSLLQNQKVNLKSVFSAICNSDEIFQENTIDVHHLNEENQKILKNMISNYKPNKIKTPNVNMKIIVTDNTPIFNRPRRLPICDQKVVENQIEEWLKEGIIQHSQSEYAAPIVLVKKKNGEKRLCCDYRRINQKIVRDNFPMTLIDDVLAKLQNAQVFTTLDLKNGFFHVPVDSESIKYTSFVTHLGQYEFRKSPFGMTNSPAAFCRYITAIFNDLILQGTVIIYMDDIVIPSQNEKENLQKIRLVLNRASEYGLQISWKKCQFVKNEINFLGYIIKNSSIKPSKEKIKAVANFPKPIDIKSVQKFLGLTSYFRRFIQNYATIAKPLTDLLSKYSIFTFGAEQEIAFAQLKDALITHPVLNIYNPYAETELHTDASKFGLGGALMQVSSLDGCWHPVEYMSRRTNTYEENYDSYQLEVLAIVAALKKWRTYLLGIHFKIVTDCVAFTQTVKKTEIPARIARWVILLQDFDYELVHRNGNKLKHVDALSRMYCYMLSRSLKHRIEQAQENDVWIQNLKKCIIDKKHPKFFIKNNLLFRDYEKELLVIPREMEEEIIQIAHRQGHFAIKKTIEIVEKNFYIPSIKEKAEKIIRNCVECIIADAKAGKKEGLLEPIEKTTKPLDTLHLDHVGPLENTKKRYNHILTIVDAFSKFTWLYPTKSTGTQEVVDILEKNAAIFGHPGRIITDRGVAFTSNIFREYCKNNNIVHILTTTGVPRGNGQVERIHKIVISLLTKLCSQNKQDWYKYLNNIQQIINNTAPRSTKISPFKILTGIDMKISGLDDLRKMLENEMLQELDDSREELRQTARENILKIQKENKQSFDKNRKEATEYQVGDMVAIKRTQFGTGLKIKPKYLGPYKITKKKRNARYEVEKIGEFEGPIKTTTIAENIKAWSTAFGANAAAGRPNVGPQDK